jgi:hypothetical protein
MHRDQRIPPVVRTGQHELEFEVFQLLLDRRDLLLDFGAGVGVVGLFCEVEQDARILDALGDLNPRCDLVAQAGKLLEDALCRLGVVPEVGRGRLFFEAGYLLLLGSEVKDAPEGLRCGRGGRSGCCASLARVTFLTVGSIQASNYPKMLTRAAGEPAASLSGRG